MKKLRSNNAWFRERIAPSRVRVGDPPARPTRGKPNHPATLIAPDQQGGQEHHPDSYGGYSANPVVDPLVTTGANRVIRGGGWGSESSFCRSATRSFNTPELLSADLGFRVVLAPILVP